jgi:ketosteroid isomerase-like protein
MQEELEPVRQPLTLAGRPGRSLDERLAVRFPLALVMLVRAIQSLPARSRIRQALARVAAHRLIAALNRGDHELTFLAFAPNCEADFAEYAALGLKASHGRQQRIRTQDEFRAGWGEYKFDPRELIDRGDDRFLIIGSFSARGSASGLALDTEWGVMVTVSSGRIIREETFWNHAEAVAAAGLSNAPASRDGPSSNCF